LNYKKEVPYSSEVAVDSFKEFENIIKIHAIVFVERESQKAIILGHEGKAIKKTGTEARMDMEKFFGKKIYLEITVKVKKEWRNDEKMLDKLGYHNV